MSRLQDLLDQVTATPELSPKQADVQIASDTKKADFNARLAVASRGTTAGSSSASEMETDARNMAPSELFLKYGTQAQDIIDRRAGASQEITKDASQERTVGEALTDSVGSALTGFSSMGLGITAAGIGAFNPRAGVSMARGIDTINRGMQVNQSEGLQASRRISDDIRQLNNRDTAKQYEQDKAKDGEVLAGLKQFGRDAANTITNLDSTQVADVSATGVGSLFTGAPLAKGLEALGKATIGRLGATKALENIAERTAAGRYLTVNERLGQAIAKGSAMPAAIGIMEGGGAYQQTASQAYNQIMDRTDLSEDQKYEMANRAGLIAGAIQAPVAGLTSAITGAAEFERHPFGVPSVGSMAANLAKEGIEEGIQSTTGQVAQNLGIRSEIDPNQNLAEGVGEQTVLGAVGGIGTAGIVQAPGLALHTAVEAAKLPFQAAGAVGRAAGSAAVSLLTARGERILAQNQVKADSIISGLNDQAKSEADTIIGSIQSDLADAPEEATPSSEGKPVSNENGLQFSGSFRPGYDWVASYEPVELSDGSYGLERNMTGQIQHLTESDTWANGPAPRTVLQAGRNAEVSNQVARFGDRDEAIANAQSDAQGMGGAPVANSTTKIEEQATEVTNPTELQTQAETLATMADMAPEKVDPQNAKDMLFQDDQGKIKLTPEQKATIRGASALVQANIAANIKATELGLPEADRVSIEVQTAKGDKDTLKKSAKTHMQGIVDAYRSGDKATAADLLGTLRKFALHMNNKVAAANEALVTGRNQATDPVRYKALNSNTGNFRITPEGQGIFINPYAPKTIKFAQQMAVDAEAVTSLANQLSEIFPDLGIDPVESVALNETLNGPAQEVADQYRAGKRKVVKTEAKPIVEEAAPVVEEVPTPEPVQEAPAVEEKPVEVVPEPEAVVVEEPRKDKLPLPKLFHGSPNTDLTLDQVEIIRDPSTQKQGKKGRVYGGFYVAAEDRISDAQGYAGDTGSVYEINLKSDAVIEEKLGDITRLSENQINEYLARGVDVVVGKDPRGRTEYAILNKDAIQSLNKQQATEPVVELKGTRALYPNLVGGENNLFHKAFRLAKNAKTRIVGVEQPLPYISDALSSEKNLRKIIEGDLKRSLKELTAEAYAGYLAYGEQLANRLEERLQEFLSKTVSKDSKITRGDLLAQGKVLDWKQGMVTNLANQNEDGSVSYNPELLQSSVLAGLQWFLKINQNGSKLEAKDVAAITGIDAEQTSTLEGLADLFNAAGVGGIELVRSLSRDIERFWGLQIDNNAPRNHSEGLFEAMAKEIVEAMEELKLFKDDQGNDIGLLQKTTFGPEDGLPADRTVNRYRPTSLGSDNAIKAFPTAIETAVLTTPEEINYLDEVPPLGSKNQLRNDKLQITDQQVEAKKIEQEIPHYLDLNFVNFLKQLGEEGVMMLFGGGGPTEGRILNKNHKRGLDGQNLTAQSAYRTLMDMLEEIQNVADLKGLPLDQVPIRYGYDFTVVNRMQMAGKNNPQSNKIMRHAILPTRATIDLTDANSREKFMMGVAQAIGTKVHNMTRDEALIDVQKRLSSLVPVIEFFQKNEGGPLTDLSLFQSMDLDPTKTYALMEYARSGLYEGEPKSDFTTSLYFEADGVANGVTNAMVLFPSGEFTKDWLTNAAKGGVLVGKSDMTLADQRKADGKDLYKTAGDSATKFLTELRNRYQGDPNVRGQLDAVREILDILLPDAEIKNGQLVIERGVTKNPLTITLYGSGAKGIAGNITSEVVSKVYEMASEAAQRQADNKGLTQAQAMFGPDAEAADVMWGRFTDAMGKLTSKSLYKDKQVLRVGRASQKTSGRGAWTEFTLSGEDIKNLQGNILEGFIGPMREAITETVGDDLMQSAVMIRKMGQAWSLVGMFAYQREYAAAHNARKASDPSFKDSDLLSRAEEDAVFEKVKNLIPMISTPTQNFMVGGRQSLDMPKSFLGRTGAGNANFEFARSTTGGLETPAFIYAPGDASVSTIPFMTIGTGDGQTIQNLITDGKAPKGRLTIYDGIHSSVAEMDEMGLAANEAVFKAWRGNPLKAVADGFAEFAKVVPTLDLNEEERDRLTRALLDPDLQPEEALTEAQIIDLIKSEADRAIGAARGAEARQIVLNMVNSSTDQMAGASKPYVNQGQYDLSGMSDDQIEKILNTLLKEVRAKLDAGEDPLSVVPEEAPAVPEPIEGTDLAKLVDDLKADRQTKMLLRDIVKSKAAEGYKIITLSEDQLSDVLTDYDGRDAAAGITDPMNKTVYLIDGRSDNETLLHELIHAATYDKVVEHYTTRFNPAVDRIEKLMAQFRKLDVFDEDIEIQTAYQDAISEMDRTDNPAAELNEFMAWALSNQALANKLKTVKVESRLARIGRAVVKAIKTVLWGQERSMTVGTDFFSNLRFNSNILMRQGVRPDVYIGQTLLFQMGNDRLNKLNERIKTKISDLVDPDAFKKAMNKVQYQQSIVRSARTANVFVKNGFTMNQGQYTSFINLLAIMGTNLDLDANATTRLQELYSHVTKDLSVESFMADPTDDTQRPLAQDKFNAVMGRIRTPEDTMNRSVLLPAFLALSMTNDEFRQILEKTKVPAGNYGPWNSTDAILDNIGEGFISNLSRIMSGEGRNSPNVKVALENLTQSMLQTAEERRYWFEKYTQPAGNTIDRANDYVIKAADFISKQGLKLSDVMDAKYNNWLSTAGSETIRAVSLMMSEQSGDKVSEGWQSMANRYELYRPLRELLTDLVGRTKTNKNVYDLIKKTRAWAQQIRQQFREHLPAILAKQFKTAPTEAEWGIMSRGLAQTDLTSLTSGYSMQTVLELASDRAKRASEISKLEDQLNAKPHGPLVITKAKQLAKYMNTKIPGSNLLANAEAIANLLGENVKDPDIFPEQIKMIDHLTTLYAIETLDEPTRTGLFSLVQREAEGVSFVMSYLVGQRKDEISKVMGNSKFNHYKGNLHLDNGAGVSLVLVPQSQVRNMIDRSYVYVKEYKGSIRERRLGNEKMVYMYAPVSARAPFAQGLMQNVQQTVSGVDSQTGFSTEMTGGYIVNPGALAKVVPAKNETEIEALVPRYDSKGKLYAYERSVDPNVLHMLNRDQDLSKAMGVWAGRQAEEASAFEVNKAVIDSLKDMWEEAQRTDREDEFIDVYKSGDKVLMDGLSIINTPASNYIKQTFGKKFMVRKDMLNDSFGYRNASIGDAWTGNSRWSDETLLNTKKALTGLFGNKAFQYVTNGEKLLQNVITDFRVAIVVKSVIVPVANMAANVLQLIGRGVPAADMFRAIPKKTTEIESYVKSRLRLIEAEAELRATRDPVLSRRLKGEVQAINDSHKRLSIWPLLQAGEFSSISDADVRDDEVKLSEGKLAEYMSQQIDKLPGPVKTMGKYAIVAKDTALFRALQKSVEYGDFVAKAILYDDLTKRQGKTPEYALGRITEEFVNYDRLPGRSRGYLESVGLLWFWNFKIRSAKVAMSMLRNNPVHTALAMMMPTPSILGSIGMPLDDNFWSSLFDGRLARSVGFGMGFRAPGLLPIGELLS